MKLSTCVLSRGDLLYEALILWRNLINVAAAFGNLKNGKEYALTALQGVGTKFATRYEQLIGEKCGLPAKWRLPPAVAEPTPTSASSGSGADVVRKASIAQFDANGKLIARDEDEKPTPPAEVINWKKWQTDSEVKDRVNHGLVTSAAYTAWSNLWFGAPAVKAVEVVKATEHNIGKAKPTRPWIVTTLEDLEPQSLLMVPYIAGLEKLQNKRMLNPDAIVVTVQVGEKIETLWVVPDFSNKTDEQVAELMGDKAFANNSRSTFWACRRSSKEGDWNCELVDMKTSVTVCTQWNCVSGLGLSPTATATVVTVPVLVNTRKIPKAGEIVLKCDPPPQVKPKPKKCDRT